MFSFCLERLQRPVLSPAGRSEVFVVPLSVLGWYHSTLNRQGVRAVSSERHLWRLLGCTKHGFEGGALLFFSFLFCLFGGPFFGGLFWPESYSDP